MSITNSPQQPATAKGGQEWQLSNLLPSPGPRNPTLAVARGDGMECTQRDGMQPKPTTPHLPPRQLSLFTQEVRVQTTNLVTMGTTTENNFHSTGVLFRAHLLHAVHHHLPVLFVVVFQVVDKATDNLGSAHLVSNLHRCVHQLRVRSHDIT